MKESMRNETNLLNKENNLSIISRMPGGILKLNCDNNELEIDFFNEELLHLFSCDREELLKVGGSIFDRFVYEDDKEIIQNMIWDADNRYGEVIHRICDSHKNVNWVLTKFRKEIENEQLKSLYFVIVDIDIKEQKEVNALEHIWYDALISFAFDIMSKAKQESTAIHSILKYICNYFEVDLAAIVELDNERMRATYVNDTAESPTFSFKEMDLSMLRHIYDYSDKNGVFILEDSEGLRSGSPMKALVNQTKAKAALSCAFYDDGEYKGCIYLEDRKRYREWTRKQVNTLITITRIISFYLIKMRVTENIKQKLDRLRNYDSLTGLPTLRLFTQKVQSLRLEYPNQAWAIIYTDVNDLKDVNENLGYDFGDQILCDFATYMRSQTKQDKVFARVTSNNFLSVVPFYSQKELVDDLIKLNKALHDEGRKKNINCNLSLSSGIYIMKMDDSNLTNAIDNANIARKQAKNSLTKQTYCFYNDEMHERKKKEQEITNNMENALAENEFAVYLQPKMDLSQDGIAGAEALVRWIKSENEILMPNDFIPIFEKNGFVLKLDYYVYEVVCKKIREWIDNGGVTMPISVNVSRVHLMEEDFIGEVLKLVDQYSIPRNLLEFELTESIFLDNAEVALVFMNQIRELGFNASIDDFGSGYSSLSLLKDISMDVLKLDKEFFRKGDMKKEDRIIVSSIISMAKQLNLKVLSEGVETTMQSEFLKTIDCDMAQGYLYSKPMPIDEFEKKYVYINEQRKMAKQEEYELKLT